MANRSDDIPDEIPPDVWIVATLHRAGWSINEAAGRGEKSRLARIGREGSGEPPVPIGGSVHPEAWDRALKEARSRGMLGPPTRGGRVSGGRCSGGPARDEGPIRR